MPQALETRIGADDAWDLLCRALDDILAASASADQLYALGEAAFVVALQLDARRAVSALDQVLHAMDRVRANPKVVPVDVLQPEIGPARLKALWRVTHALASRMDLRVPTPP
jgi:hypothetical protein